MPKRSPSSKTQTSLLGFALAFLLAVAVPWVACRLDTSPRRAPVRDVSTDDAGDDDQ